MLVLLDREPWSALPESAAKPLLPPMEPLPTDAPGRYAFANPDRVKSIVLRAGFHAPEFRKFDAPILLGTTPEAASSPASMPVHSPGSLPKWMTRQAKTCATPSPLASRGRWAPAAFT